MRKKIVSIISTFMAVAVLCACLFTGCSNNNGGTGEYTIQYTYDKGTYQLTVNSGMPYVLDVIPEKTGYNFKGLFDKEEGGTQYVSSSGASVAPFSAGKNLVLFPQFEVKSYTVILDYQQAQVTGSRQVTVFYGESLPELPKDLSKEHKQFTGWYTAENCGGTQVADKYGLIPVVSVLSDKYFDVSGEYITLYAGFEAEKITVTCAFNFETNAEKIQVDYGTPVSDIVTKTRINGEAPLTWSKTQDGEVFNGNVEEEMTLYALEFAPVIDFDSNGGSEVKPVIARAGSVVALPTPVKELAKFSHWEDMQGDKYTETSMPSKSISLKAVWQAKLVFDENGGSEVDDISIAAGESITLPTPEKDGFIFAGWYTAEKEQYTSSKMPAAGLVLKAGWYKEQSKNTVVISSTSSDSARINKASVNSMCYKVKYDNYSSGNNAINIRLSGHFKIKSTWAESYGAMSAYLEVYSQQTISSSYLLVKEQFEGVTGSYRDYNFEISLNISDDAYLCFYHACQYTTWPFNISDFYYTVYYPDTTNLYL
ncbi:MAG: InlB B-repeat-containing protein [Clostridia bacterium]|nr:InlB B-repeat-containing protein [Clostridia bacterium]